MKKSSKKTTTEEFSTGKELYEHLKDKSQKEIQDFFVARGAKVVNGIILNNVLYLLYKIEKEKRERLDTDKSQIEYDGDFDGLER